MEEETNKPIVSATPTIKCLECGAITQRKKLRGPVLKIYCSHKCRNKAWIRKHPRQGVNRDD